METIGKYLIEKKLGQGGMGIVYKCTHPDHEHPAAVKVLPQQLAADPSFLQRFKREIITLQRLDHPNIIKIIEQGDAAGSWYYAMEYADGVSLEDVLAGEKRLDPLRAVGIIRSCAEALEHSHSRGVVHRDIKPANIMLIKDDGIKLMDFGIAKVLDATRMTMTQGVLGTVEYMSPEQSQGRMVDARSDIYSLGVVFYRCLTGRLPIVGSTPTEVIMKLRTQQVDPPKAWLPELSKRCNDLVMRMLEKDPAKRVESARELLRELDRVEQQMISEREQGKTPTSERVLTTGVAPSPAAWRNPWVIALVVLAIGFGAWFLWHQKQLEQAASTVETESAGRDTGYKRRELMLEWARRSLDRDELDTAQDLYEHIVRFYPNSKEAKAAENGLAAIATKRRIREAEEAEAQRKAGLPPAIPNKEE
jgi:serine/threonine protein kinase